LLLKCYLFAVKIIGCLLIYVYSAQVYMDDSLGDRVWVDRADCRAFVENIQTAFGTRLPSVSMLASEMAVKPETACESEYVSI